MEIKVNVLCQSQSTAKHKMCECAYDCVLVNRKKRGRCTIHDQHNFSHNLWFAKENFNHFLKNRFPENSTISVKTFILKLKPDSSVALLKSEQRQCNGVLA